MSVLTVLQQAMLGRDLLAERGQEIQWRKTVVRDRFVAAAADGHWSRSGDLPVWARAAASAVCAQVPVAVDIAAPGRTRPFLRVCYQTWGAVRAFAHAAAHHPSRRRPARPAQSYGAGRRSVGEHRLRTLDALHLAVVLTAAATLADEVVLLSRDARQAGAAAELGLAVR